MGFLFGLLTGIFVFVTTVAIVVVHVFKINLDLPHNDVTNIQNGTTQTSVAIRESHNNLSDISETQLRQIIQNIIAETVNLTPLTNNHAATETALDRSSRPSDNRQLTNTDYNQRYRTKHYFKPSSYQELLATAVLNKIVDKQLNNNQDVSEKDIGGDSDGASGQDVNDTIKLATSHQNSNIEKLSTSSGSSVEPRSDCSYPEIENLINNNDDKSFEPLRNSDRDSVLSDYLANHMIPLPDLNAIAIESDEDDYISVTSSAIGDDTWEKNWLFKKKKSTLSGSVAANTVGMLVPDPKEDVRAQIGDKTTDEVSDLSELGSDSDDSLNSLGSQLEPINDRVINKHLIGGQNSKIILDEIIERSSMISNTFPTDIEPIYTDACNEHIIDAKTKNEAINHNLNQQNNSDGKQLEDSREALGPVALDDFNSNSLPDQLSYDSNPYDRSRTSTVEEYIYNDYDDMNTLALSSNNKSFPKTNITFNTNTCTKYGSMANTNIIKNCNHNQSVTNVSGFITTTPYKQNHHNSLLTSANQCRGTTSKHQSTRRQFHGDLIQSDHRSEIREKTYNYGNDSDHKNTNIFDAAIKDNNDYNAHNNDCMNINEDVKKDDDYNDDDNDDDDNDDDDIVAILRHFVPGSIAEREYKKWYNAVEMPNNPYAPEALKRRISSSQERFIDLPNISPIKDLNPLDLLNEPKLDAYENIKLESNYKRYSRDYYINSSLITPQMSSAKEEDAIPTAKDNRETTKKPLSFIETGSEIDLYKAVPAQVVETNSCFMASALEISAKMELNLTSASDDSDTIKNQNSGKQNDINAEKEDKTTVGQRDQESDNEIDLEEKPSRSENGGSILTAAHGSTPVAFKFLQPKRKLLQPNQVLTMHEQELETASLDKPVIEAEVAKALPSVKALAKAFLMTSNTTQPEKRWFRKAKTLSQGAKKCPTSPKRSLDQLIQAERLKPEDDVTITSDLSSLETDSSSFSVEKATTSDLTPPTSPTFTSNVSPVPVRQGVLKDNIAFFENLKNN